MWCLRVLSARLSLIQTSDFWRFLATSGGNWLLIGCQLCTVTRSSFKRYFYIVTLGNFGKLVSHIDIIDFHVHRYPF